MADITLDNIDGIYYTLLQKLKQGVKTGNTRELNNVCVCLTNINQNIVSIRNLSVAYMFAELIWYFDGRRDTDFIGRFASMWKRISDDGVTNNSAYGYLMRYKYGFDQVEKIIELLKTDPLSRRAVINLNVPNEHVIETKDEPCTIALQFLVRKGRLNCTAIMRSNDIWFGFPYDVIFFTELQKYIADKLGVQYGTYTHFVTSVHLYDRDYDKVISILKNPISKPIYFNRKNFIDHYGEISAELDMKILNGSDNIKSDLFRLLREHDIYVISQEDNNED